MLIDISHRLSFPGSGARAVEHLLLTPLSGPTQTVREWSIEMPGIETAARFTDAYGNRALLVSQPKAEGEIAIEVRGRVETHDRNGVLGRIPGEPVVALYRRATALAKPEPRVLEALAGADRQGAARIALLHAVMDRLGELYRFGRADAADGQSQSQSQGGQSQTQSQGEPADARPAADAPAFAHAFVGTLRALDIPARYVTGYRLADEGAPAAFHAWAEAYDQGLGWIGFDAALGVCPTDRHVRVAAELDMQSTFCLRIVPLLAAMPAEDLSVSAGQ